jgi:hypothetical protein
MTGASLQEDDRPGNEDNRPALGSSEYPPDAGRFALSLLCDVRQSPNEMPVALAVRTVSWFGSTRFGSARA